jgi:hypothetical protein
MNELNEVVPLKGSRRSSYKSLKISEADIADLPNKSETLRKEIARMSFQMASKLPFASNEQGQDIQAALSLMTQAMMMANDDKLFADARRHLGLARRLAR